MTIRDDVVTASAREWNAGGSIRWRSPHPSVHWISPHRHVGGLSSGNRKAHLSTVTLFLNGSAYCEARLAGSGFGAQSIWILELTKPLAPTDGSFLLQVGDDETKMVVDLLKSSSGSEDLRIVIGLPGY